MYISILWFNGRLTKGLLFTGILVIKKLREGMGLHGLYSEAA